MKNETYRLKLITETGSVYMKQADNTWSCGSLTWLSLEEILKALHKNNIVYNIIWEDV